MVFILALIAYRLAFIDVKAQESLTDIRLAFKSAQEVINTTKMISKSFVWVEVVWEEKTIIRSHTVITGLSKQQKPNYSQGQYLSDMDISRGNYATKVTL